MSTDDRLPSRPRRFVLSAYSGEHGIYGVVLTTAMVAIGWDQDDDLDVIVFVVGTVVVFWLAHLYAAVVASRATEEGRTRPMRDAVRTAARHSGGMIAATLIPVVLLLLGVVGIVSEWTAYYLALWSGVVILAFIGYANSARNHGSVARRLAGAAVTACLGLIVIGLSTLVH